MKKIAVFGATGQTGRLICQLLLDQDQDIQILACARTLEKLEKLQASLDSSGTRLTTHSIDLHNTAAVDSILGQVDLAVGATSQWQDGPALAARALEASIHYCGINLSNAEKWEQLRNMHDNSVERGISIVDDCGTHPALPGAMIRWVNQRTRLRAAWVAGKFDLQWESLGLVEETITDFIAEIENADPSVFTDGHWKKGYSNTRQFDFGTGKGPETCTPMLMEEIHEVVQTESLQSTGFYIAGFGTFIDYVIIPLSLVLSKINRKLSRNLLWWGLRRHASRPSFALVQLDGEREDGTPVKMTVAHDDPYYATAAPVVATILQALANPKPGVWTQAAFVETDAFFDSLQQMGLKVETR